MLNEIIKKYLNIDNKLIYIINIYMSDQENNLVQPKKTAKTPKFKKNGEPDQRSVKSSANMSKARSRVKEFLKAGKQIVQQSDSEDSSDEIIDLVVRKKETAKIHMELGSEQEEEEDRQPIRRLPKPKLKRQPRIQSDDETEQETEEPQIKEPKPKSERKLQFEEMKTRHESLQLEFQELKKGDHRYEYQKRNRKDYEKE